MKIAILSRNAKLYSTMRLVEAARARGHRARVLDPLRCYMRIEPGAFAMHYKGRSAGRLRRGDSAHRRFDHVLRHRRAAPVRDDGRVHAEFLGRDPARARQAALPATAGARKHRACRRRCSATIRTTPPICSRMLGDPPHVIKLNEGAQGQGVLLAEKRSVSQSVIEAFRGLYANFLVQEFIREAKGADIRCFVVGGKVVAAMRRQGREGEFRSNLHRGGIATAVDLSRGGDRHRAARSAHDGPEHRRRRPAALAARTAGAGSQFLARPGRHRGGDRGRCCRRDHRIPRAARAQAPARSKVPSG